MTSIIRNHDLAAAGQKKIAWVEHYMPTLNNIGERLKKEQTFQDKQWSSVFTWKPKRRI